MRKLNPQLSAHLSGEVLTTCTCWIVKRKDGIVLGFTDHDVDVRIEDVGCIARSGFEATEALNELGLSADDQDIAGAFSNEAIEKDDLVAGRYDGALVELWMVNWQDNLQRHHLKTAVLGEVQWEGERFKVELRGLTSVLDQPVGRVYARRCDAMLGDNRCTVDLQQATYKASGAVTSVINQKVIFCSGLDQHESGWFNNGNLTFLTGRNSGFSVELAGSGTTHEQLNLWLAPPFPIEVGDKFDVTAGCDKNFSTCRSKFSNGLNFQGCPHMPVGEFVFNYADKLTQHDGSPLVK